MKNVLFASILFSAFSLSINAQSITLKSGDVKLLKYQTKMDVVFDYSNMAVGKFDKEEDYVNKKVKDYNSDEPSKGDTWKKNWISDRSRRFEPKFFELFNKYIEDAGFFAAINSNNANYIVVVHTTFTEPGFNIGIMRKPAMINAEISFKDKATNKDLAVLLVNNCPGSGGMGYDFDCGFRIAEGYAKLGKALGKYLVKHASK